MPRTKRRTKRRTKTKARKNKVEDEVNVKQDKNENKGNEHKREGLERIWGEEKDEIENMGQKLGEGEQS